MRRASRGRRQNGVLLHFSKVSSLPNTLDQIEIELTMDRNTHCNTPQRTATLQHSATTLLHTATTLQHTAITHCKRGPNTSDSKEIELTLEIFYKGAFTLFTQRRALQKFVNVRNNNDQTYIDLYVIEIL